MTKPVVKLIDEDENAFAVLAKVNTALKKAGMEKEAKEFMAEATLGGYDHLLQTVIDYVEIE